MIVYCEECGAKNELADITPGQSGERVRCRVCNDFLIINPKHRPPDDESSTAGQPALQSRLLIDYKNIHIVHAGPGRQITLGRHEKNDIRVPDERVSRMHAVIEYKQGKFCLIDQSLNGTYILIQNRYGRTIKNKEIMLVSQGVIGLGGMVDEKSPDAIRYRIESP